jgi:hypothetical protein
MAFYKNNDFKEYDEKKMRLSNNAANSNINKSNS